MTPLSNQQKQLLFDYCVGVASKEEAIEAETLISSNKEAAEIHSTFKIVFEPLESLRSESCPDDLAEGTVWRLNNLARSSQLQLEQLLAAEQKHDATEKSSLWVNLGKRLAIAAVFMVVGGALITAFNIVSNYARQQSLQQQCQMQLFRIGQAIDNYKSDHEGAAPAVATAAGAPWWKVGDQGDENQSNTRHMWLLVKDGYINPADFVCPGSKHSGIIKLDPAEIKNYNDFPDRKHVTFSFRIRCDKSKTEDESGRKVLIADLSPVFFERLPKDYSEQLKLQLDKALLTLNSINHNHRGQNALFSDGSIEFIKSRQVGITGDDIFTLQNTEVYHGVEVPSSETDVFLAP
jgi:hypothetical protein